ncbi:MAG: hypothetical protein L0241_18805, partial [Planctomycetia bacterium]|nr:hypothetical protein [Planctomycetia bacterium]
TKQQRPGIDRDGINAAYKELFGSAPATDKSVGPVPGVPRPVVWLPKTMASTLASSECLAQ